MIQNKILKEGTLYLAFLFFLLIPLLFEHIAIEPTNVPRFILANVLLFCWLGYRLFLGTAQFQFLFVPFVLIVSFYGLSLLGGFWALNTADLIYESQKTSISLGLIILFYSSLRDLSFMQSIGKTIQLVLAVILLIYYFQLFSSASINMNIFGHENLLSSFVFLCLPFLFIDFKNIQYKFKIVRISLFLGGITLLFLIGTRSVILAILISALFYLVIRWSYQWQSWKRWALAIIAGLTIIIGIIIVKENLDRIKSSHFNSSLLERSELWGKTTKLVYENPTLGVGTGNWQYNYSKFSVNDIEKASYYNTFFKRPHNDYLWILSENGFIGFLIISFLLIWMGRHVLNTFYQNKDQRLLIFTSVGVGLLVISFFSFPKERIAHIVMAALIFSILCRRINDENLRKVNLNRTFALGAMVIFALNCWIGLVRVKGEYFTMQSVNGQSLNNATVAIENGKKALHIFYTNDPSGTPIESYIGWGYNLKTDLPNLLTANENAYRLSPYDYKVLSNYGYALLRLGYFQKADEILKEAHRINSNYEPVLLNKSVLAFNQGQFAEALNWLESIKDYEIKYPDNLRRIQERLIE